MKASKPSWALRPKFGPFSDDGNFSGVLLIGGSPHAYRQTSWRNFYFPSSRAAAVYRRQPQIHGNRFYFQTNQHNGETKGQEEDACGLQEPGDRCGRSRRHAQPQEHGDSHWRWRGRLQRQPAGGRRSQGHGARYRQPTQGEERQQVEGLRGHDGPAGRYTSPALLAISKRQHQPAHRNNTSRTDAQLQGREVLPVQGRPESSKETIRTGQRRRYAAIGMYHPPGKRPPSPANTSTSWS